jgi:hypothetical protein
MLAPAERKLLEPLAPALRKKAIAALEKPLDRDGRPPKASNDALIEVFDALEMPPANGPVILPSAMTPAQRGLALVLASRDAYPCYGAPFPRSGALRRRWLGLDKGGVLEREVAFAHDGEPSRVPLWRALGVLSDAPGRNQVVPFLKALRLPLVDRLALLAEVARDAYGLQDLLPYVEWVKLSELRSADPVVTAWAVREADAYGAAMAAPSPPPGSAVRGPRPSVILLWPMFAALMAAKVPLSPAWDLLVPAGTKPDELALLRRIAKALPDARRGPALARAIQPLWGAHSVELGLALLDDFPSRELAESVLGEADDAGAMSRRDVIKALEKVGKRHPVVAAVVAPVSRKQKPPLVLHALAGKKPRAVSDLGPLEQKQLVAAGKRFDGKALPASTRLSKDKAHEEVSFAGLFEIREIVDAKDKPAYTALLYAGDSGTIFAAGSTRAVASVIQFGIECDDERLAEALHLALRAKPKAKPRRSGATGARS